MNKPTQNQQRITLDLGEKEAEGIYSNLTLITNSPAEFILDFARLVPGMAKSKVHARVTDVNAAAGTFKISPVTGQEITVTITTGTQLEDDVSEIEPFTLNNLVVDDFVEVRGFDNGNGGITAIEIDVKEPDKVVVQGIATAATGDSSNGTITVFGITFYIDNKTDFEDANDVDLSVAAVNSLLNNISITPQLVKVEDKKAGDDENPPGTADGIDIESP